MENTSTTGGSQIGGIQGAQTRPLTFGEKAVGFSFNPGGNMRVTEIKTLYAQIIDLLSEERNAVVRSGENEKFRLYSIAITEAQTAQMWAVKAITWQ